MKLIVNVITDEIGKSSEDEIYKRKPFFVDVTLPNYTIMTR